MATGTGKIVTEVVLIIKDGVCIQYKMMFMVFSCRVILVTITVCLVTRCEYLCIITITTVL